MKSTILNREFQHPADGWYHIEPAGEHPAVMRSGEKSEEVLLAIDDEAVQTIVNRFNQAARDGTLRHGHELLIDHEHFSDDLDKETRAYGWLQELQARADGIYARVRWTTTGKAAVDGGDYRFFSTEYDRPSLKILNGQSPKRLRPMQLDGLTLTNMNNNRGQKPITNRDSTTFAGAGASADQDKNINKRKNMQRIAQALGLAAEASEDSILAAITKLKEDAGKAGQMQGEVETLTNRIKVLDTEQVDGLLEQHGIKDEKVLNRLKPVLAGMQNREERSAFLTDCGFKPESDRKDQSTKPGTGKVLNRGEARPPAGAAAGNDEATMARKQQEEIEDYRIKNRCSYEQARNRIRQLKPELFGLS